MWIEIFRSGKHTSSSGIVKQYSPEDIKNIEIKYNDKISKDESFTAPLVKGHPKDNDPAYGWIEKLATKGSILLAKIKNPDSSLINEVKEGKFKKISIALYPDMMLRHVGLLGAASPAVKGLQPVTFNSDDKFIEYSGIDYSVIQDRNEMSEEIESLKLQNKKLHEQIDILNKERRLSDYRSYAESISQKRHFISPSLTNELIDIFEAVYTGSGDKSGDIIDKIKNFVDAIEPQELLSNLPIDRSNVSLHTEKGAIHNKAIEIKNINPDLSYEEAVLEAQSYFYK